MQKLRATEEGKQFEVYVKFLITKRVAGAEYIVGAAYAGSFTACRAVHAALYKSAPVELFEEETNTLIKIMTSAKDFRRIETTDGRVMHHFLTPRSSVDEDYQMTITERAKNNPDSDALPSRILLAPYGNIEEVTGHFIADTYGLPRTWLKEYSRLFSKQIQPLAIIKEEQMAGKWTGLQAVEVAEMKESYVLETVHEAIKQGHVQTRSQSLLGDAVFREDMSTEQYVLENAHVLAEKLDVYIKPLTDGSVLSKYLGEANRISLPAQARASMGVLEVLKKKKGLFLVGDMGTGKTQMSLTSVYVYARNREQSGAQDGIRVLIIAPGNVVPKWASQEIPKVIKKSRFITRILKNTNDALEYVNEVKRGRKVPKGKIEFVLVSTDRMKLTSEGFVLGAKWDAHRRCWISPDTGAALQRPAQKKDESEEDAIAMWKDAVISPLDPPAPEAIREARENGTLLPNGLPKGFVRKWRADIRAFQEEYKSEKKDCSLARPARKEWKETGKSPRWMIAQILHRQLPNHFHFGILDEAHQMKASDTGRGAAMAKILKSCRKLIMLTGTLTNGASTSIQALLWRVFPGEQLDSGVTSKEQWVYRYGVVEKVVTQNDENKTVGSSSNRKEETVIVKERPGISSKLLTDFLLDKCVFLELPELNTPLVEIEEIPLVFPLEDDHKEEYDCFHSTYYEMARANQKQIGSAAWSKFNAATINYADQPQVAPFIGFFDREGAVQGTVSAPAFPADYLNEKETTLIETILSELAVGRRNIVYTRYSSAVGEYRTNQRLTKILSDNDVRVKVLDGNVPTAKRFDWLEQQAKSDVEVIICNQQLVEVGLDLMAFQSIHFYQMSDDINVVRQAGRRAWRLGQNKKCKVFYYVAESTTQEVQFKRLMSRRVSAMIVEGRIERSSDLAQYADTSASELTATLSKSLETTDLAKAWKQAAESDISEDLELVSEDEFQERLNQAFKQLTAETLEKCGYSPEQEEKAALSEEDFDVDFDALDSLFAEFEASTDWDALDELLAEEERLKKQEIWEARKKQPAEQWNHAEQLDLFGDLIVG